MAEPFQAFRFAVHIEGIEEAIFAECSGLEASTEVQEYQEGGENQFVHKLPGRTKYGNVTLKRGFTESLELWRWFESTARGQVEYRNASIVQYGFDCQEVRRWNLNRAYPVKWSGPSFKVDGSAVGIETLELAHHGFTVG